MPRYLSVLVFLVLVPCTLHAQENPPPFLFGGTFQSGLRMLSAEGKHQADIFSDTIGLDWGNDAGHAYRIDVNCLYSAGFFGIKAGVRQQHEKSTNSQNLSCREIFGFLNLWDNKINIKLGIIDTPVWNSAGIKNVEFSNGAGLRVEFMPVTGLNAGFFLGSTRRLINLEGETLENLLKTATLGMSYQNKYFRVSASYRPWGLPKGKIARDFLKPGELVSNQFIAGFGITAIPNLSVTGEFLFADGFGEAGKKSNYHWEINQGLNYQLGFVNIGFEFHERPYGSRRGEHDFEAAIGPTLNFSFAESMSAGIEAPLTLGNETRFALMPVYKWNLNSKSVITIFDKIRFLPEFRNVFQIDIVIGW